MCVYIYIYTTTKQYIYIYIYKQYICWTVRVAGRARAAKRESGNRLEASIRAYSKLRPLIGLLFCSCLWLFSCMFIF